MRFISLFNTKSASIICLLISIACRVANILFVSFIGRDKIIVMQHSRNFLEGNGFSIARYFTANMDVAVYDHTPIWPPGYPMLLSPFLRLFNNDLYWATTSLDLLFAIAFIFIVRKIATELNFPLAAINIITLVAGCFEYAFIYKSLPTDISAFVFFLVGFLLFLQLVKNEKFQFLKLATATFFLFLPCTFRYSYPPLSAAVPSAVIFIGWYMDKRQLIKTGTIGLILISALIFTFLFLLKKATGSAGYIVDTGRGFFPENFIHWAPFITESFINTIFTSSQIINKVGLSLQQVITLLDMINAVLFVGVIGAFIFLFFKKKFFIHGAPFSNFLLIGFFVSAATCISLSYLTLTYRPQPGWGNYQGEPRYFMFINLFLQFSFIGWVFLYPAWRKSIFQKLVIIIFSFVLFVEVTHNIYLYTKVSINPNEYTAPDEEPDYVYFISAIDTIKRNSPDAEVWVVSDRDEFFPLLTNYLGHKGIYDGDNMVKKMPVVKKKTILLLALYDIEMELYNQFLVEHHAKFLNRVAYVNFYRIDLLP